MTIIVTGGAGFIGSRLCKRLKKRNMAFSILDKRESRAFPDETVLADICDPNFSRLSSGKPTHIIHLAAEHRDDVTPKSLYYDVNVRGTENIIGLAKSLSINSITFTSSVAVYGFAPRGTDENGKIRPFNDYGRTKAEAEQLLVNWQLEAPDERVLTIVRPTVVFGEGNRGNVYNLLAAIDNSRFVMIGDGKNVKSLAYVENVAAFLEFSLGLQPGTRVFNYVDKPDFEMRRFVDLVYEILGRRRRRFRLPFLAGLAAGKAFDIFAAITGKKLAISAIRVRKFCADSMYGTAINMTGFVPPASLLEGLRKTVAYEFLESHEKNETWVSE
jgi:nucleoside-diphosphate-sugar epimerase